MNQRDVRERVGRSEIKVTIGRCSRLQGVWLIENSSVREEENVVEYSVGQNIQGAWSRGHV
jgi:hypothetical protein